MSQMKQCSKCRVDLVVGVNVYKNQYKCKSCVREYRRKWDTSESGVKSQKKWANTKVGVYGIFSNNKCLYIGESSWLNKRLNIHKSCIKNPQIAPSSHIEMYYNLQQYTNIEFKILEETPNHKEREQYWINQLKPKYNKT